MSYEQSEHSKGWCAYGMSVGLPTDASEEFVNGYREARNHAINIVLSGINEAQIAKENFT